MCILDILSLKVKTGISHPRLRPVLAVVDPLTTLTPPPHVTASCGMDILCHALESYTARPYQSLPAAAAGAAGRLRGEQPRLRRLHREGAAAAVPLVPAGRC